MTIILYDIPSTVPGSIWSPNTLKTRYTLNYKGIPFTTEWVEYPDIEALCKKFNIKPTSKKPDGRDHFTLPAIHDPSTGVYIADSFLIAEYLDKTYPDTPPIFPHNTAGLHRGFAAVAFSQMIDPLWDFILTPSCYILNPASREYFRRTREEEFGKTMEDIVPKGDLAISQWSKLQEGMRNMDTWYAKTDYVGPYMMGNEISWGDIHIASFLSWMKIVWGEDDEKWKDVTGWQGGRWGRLLQNLKKYTEA